MGIYVFHQPPAFDFATLIFTIINNFYKIFISANIHFCYLYVFYYVILVTKFWL